MATYHKTTDLMKYLTEIASQPFPLFISLILNKADPYRKNVKMEVYDKSVFDSMV
jgi:hypothetical protein